jgi:hypothetical protein
MAVSARARKCYRLVQPGWARRGIDAIEAGKSGAGPRDAAGRMRRARLRAASRHLTQRARATAQPTDPTMSLSLILAYAALLLLLACALLWSRWPGWMKTVVVAGVTVLYFYGHAAVHSIWGIPSTDALPERFLMLSAVVQEPTARGPGALYLWVSELREGQPLNEPRAYRLAYTKELHAQIDEGLKRGRDGVSQMGTAEPKPVKPGTGGFAGLKPGPDEQEIKIRDLPAPQLPEK